jgi:hypothetical protein
VTKREYNTADLGNPRRLKSAGNATWSFNKFSAAVRAAMIHVLSAVHAKGALKTADECFPSIGQANRAFLTYITHL